MNPHPYFDLQLHTNDELAERLGTSVIERTTLHEWPLSCVQRLTLQDNRAIIYKTECGPTVEAEFYTHARSPLLLPTQIIFRDNHYACLFIDDLQAPLLEDLSLNEAQALQVGHELLAAIAQIKGQPPVYLDVSSWESWQAIMSGMVQDIEGLIASGKYQHTTRAALRAISHAAAHPAVQQVFQTGPLGLVHSDLSGDNVFQTSQGYKIIDWQRPIFGPTAVDLVLLLTSLGFDPRPHVAEGVVAITDLLRIHWLTECSLCWFPSATDTYDQMIAHISSQL